MAPLLRSIALCSVSMLSFSMSAQIPWTKAKLGMSVSEVSQIYPQATAIEPALKNKEHNTYSPLEIKNSNFAGINFKSRFVFANDQLQSIEIFNEIPDNISTIDTLKHMVSLISKDYGTPQVGRSKNLPPGCSMAMFDWSPNNILNIKLIYMKKINKSTYCISIVPAKP